MLKECCYKNVEPMATPRGERSGQLGVISNKKVRKDTDFFLGPSGPTKPGIGSRKQRWKTSVMGEFGPKPH